MDITDLIDVDDDDEEIIDDDEERLEEDDEEIVSGDEDDDEDDGEDDDEDEKGKKKSKLTRAQKRDLEFVKQLRAGNPEYVKAAAAHVAKFNKSAKPKKAGKAKASPDVVTKADLEAFASEIESKLETRAQVRQRIDAINAAAQKSLKGVIRADDREDVYEIMARNPDLTVREAAMKIPALKKRFKAKAQAKAKGTAAPAGGSGRGGGGGKPKGGSSIDRLRKAAEGKKPGSPERVALNKAVREEARKKAARAS